MVYAYAEIAQGKGAQGWGISTAYVFAGTGLIGLVLVFFFVPEHRGQCAQLGHTLSLSLIHLGRTYGELNELYETKVPARKFRTTQTSVQRAAETQMSA